MVPFFPRFFHIQINFHRQVSILPGTSAPFVCQCDTANTRSRSRTTLDGSAFSRTGRSKSKQMLSREYDIHIRSSTLRTLPRCAVGSCRIPQFVKPLADRPICFSAGFNFFLVFGQDFFFRIHVQKAKLLQKCLAIFLFFHKLIPFSRKAVAFFCHSHKLRGRLRQIIAVPVVSDLFHLTLRPLWCILYVYYILCASSWLCQNRAKLFSALFQLVHHHTCRYPPGKDQAANQGCQYFLHLCTSFLFLPIPFPVLPHAPRQN